LQRILLNNELLNVTKYFLFAFIVASIAVVSSPACWLSFCFVTFYSR